MCATQNLRSSQRNALQISQTLHSHDELEALGASYDGASCRFWTSFGVRAESTATFTTLCLFQTMFQSFHMPQVSAFLKFQRDSKNPLQNIFKPLKLHKRKRKCRSKNRQRAYGQRCTGCSRPCNAHQRTVGRRNQV